MISCEQRPEFFAFINEILNVNFQPPMSVCMANISDTGDILGVVAYSRFTPWNCELSVASSSPRFLTRTFLRAVFLYPFKQCGMRRVTAVIEDGNIAALDMDTRLGFVREADLQGWYGERNGVMLRMLKEECKWI